MNALTKHESAALPAVQITDAEFMEVMQSSVYPGAAVASVKLALNYCKASGLDPLQKPVHLVPMNVASGRKDEKGWDIKEMRDVVMPGIGLYRSQAAKTGEYVGMSEPSFGPTKTLNFKAASWVDDGGRRKKVYAEESMEYPEWCSITVRRSVGGIVCEFPAREYWLENYATKGNDSVEPNAMWRKRPFGQISKCAEAQALRKAFPGQVGSQPTAEEMEGKTLMDEADADRTVDVKATDVKPTFYSQDDFDANTTIWKKVIDSKKQTPDGVIAKVNSANPKTPLSEDQKKAIRALATPADPKAKDDVTDVQSKPDITYAKVADSLNKATEQQQLDDAGALIAGIQDEKQRAELSAIYDRRQAELNAD